MDSEMKNHQSTWDLPCNRNGRSLQITNFMIGLNKTVHVMSIIGKRAWLCRSLSLQLIKTYTFRRTVSLDLVCRTQCAKKVVSNSLGLEEFAIGLVNSVFNLPNGQVKFFEEFKLHKHCVINPHHQKAFGASWSDFWASTCQLQLSRMESCKTDFLCNLTVIYLPLLFSLDGWRDCYDSRGDYFPYVWSVG